MLARLRRLGPLSISAAAIAALALGWALMMHALGWGQLANYAQVRSLSQGEAQIDRWHWETQDIAYSGGHYYSVKAPGLAAMTLPAYMALDAAGAQRLGERIGRTAAASDHPHWVSHATPPFGGFGFSEARARAIGDRVEAETPIVWVLTLLGALLPAVLMLVLVARLSERIEPGYGAAAAITLGLGTIVMTFASEYFPHIAAAALGFAAFALLFKERRGPPRTVLVAGAGLLAGLAVNFEYPLVLAGGVFFVYAVSRAGSRLPRAAAYTGAGLLGILPTLLFNWWALGSPLHFAYADAVAVPGVDGHAVLGLNSDGFFGITVPAPDKALDLLLANRGLLTLTPVLVMGIAGAVAMRSRGFRAEGNVILAIFAVYFLYNAGYWLPFGGGTPGPRFLIPTLPFLALGLATAWRRWPALTLGLAIPSAVFMLAGALTYPLLGNVDGTNNWADKLGDGDLEHTLLTVAGVKQGWLAVAPVLAAVGAAVALAVTATPARRLGGIAVPLAAVAAWAALSVLGPTIASDQVTPLDGGGSALWLVGAGALSAAATLVILRYRERRRAPIDSGIVVGAPALGERIS
ncbi:MAG: hypothetical protein ACXWEA_05405 [Solirubrobacterales bacterium]